MLLNTIFTMPQALNAPPREGLPFWLFWLLVCVIFLLVVIIFLRDKELRRRVDGYFLQLKKRMIKFRLKAKLKKVVRRKEELLMELGQTTYLQRLPVPRGENIRTELDKLERTQLLLQQELNDKESRITELKSRLGQNEQDLHLQVKNQNREKTENQEKILILKEQEKKTEMEILEQQKILVEQAQRLNRRRKEILDLNDAPKSSEEETRTERNRINDSMRRIQSEKETTNLEIQELLSKKIKLADESALKQKTLSDNVKSYKIREDKAQRTIRDLHKEIREWEKGRDRLLEKMASLKKKQRPLFESLGMLIENERIDNNELTVYYSRIDRANTRISDIKQQIEALT